MARRIHLKAKFLVLSGGGFTPVGTKKDAQELAKKLRKFGKRNVRIRKL